MLVVDDRDDVREFAATHSRVSGTAATEQAMAATCPRCAHNVRLDMLALAQRYGDLLLDELEARLRCRRCGRRGAKTTMVWSVMKPVP
jgi:hypothetical protein